MRASELEPPALPKRLLAWVLPSGVDGLTILGDVLEEFRERAHRDGVRAARRWYRWQAMTLTARIAGNPDRPRRLIAQTISDLRLAWRSMSRAPGIMLAIVLTIGLAVGANTALFSVFDGLLFRPLPYTDADRIVHVALNPAARASLSDDELDQALDRARSTSSLTQRTIARPATLLDRSGAAVTDWGLRTYQLSASAFDLLGVRPMLGRPFAPEDRTGPRYAVLIAHDIWRTRFGGDPEIVGRSIQIPGTAPDQPWRVVGVMPPGFSFPEGANFWVPDYRFWAEPQVTPYARLAPGVTLESLRAELPHLTITPLREHVRPQGASALALLLAGTTSMLLVAWVQVAALLFARATGRAAEIGVRLALGATRGRLMRQFTLEGAVLILLALALAALIGPALTAWIVSVLPTDMTLGQHLAPDIRAFLFAAGLSAIGFIALVLLPVDLIRRCSPALLLRGTAAGAIFRRATRVRTALFVGQLAIATSLVYLTGLAAQSFVKVVDASLGFAPEDLYAIRLPRGDSLFAGDARTRRDQRQKVAAETIDAIRRLSGVRGVAGANSWPLQPDGLSDATFVPDADPTRTPVTVRRGSILPGYPAVLGVSLLEGAEPTSADLARITREAREDERWFALANQTLARQLELLGPVVGQVLSGRYQIVGVMPDVILERADRRIEPTVLLYLPPIADVNVILVRLEPGRTVQQAGIATVLERMWHTPAPRPFPVADAVTLAASDYRARTFLLGLVAILTVPLTMLGVAGALTYAMKQRAREIAIELAIGADPRDIRGRIIRHTMVAATAAVVIGLTVGIGTGHVMSTALYGVHAADPIAVAISMAMVLLVAWVAALVPAHRAGRFNLTTVLRES
jgi:predicted permease